MTRLDHLHTLKDGWLDGDGKAPSRASLYQAALLMRIFTDLRAYPTFEGGVNLEHDDYEIEVLQSGKFILHP